MNKENQIETELYKEELDSIYKALDIERGVARPQTTEIIQALKNTIKSQAKQINLMAKYWNTGLAMCDNCDKIVEKYEKNNCENCIKQYFSGLVEKEN